MRTSWLRRVGDHGASAVEFALIMPIFFMMVFGMISAGFAFNQQLSLTHAAREASRYGATLALSEAASIDAWLGLVSSIAVASADGNLADTVPQRYVCVSYLDNQGGVVMKKEGTAAAVAGTCYTDGRPLNERRVQVVVKRHGELSVVILPTWDLTLSSSSVSRYEAHLQPTPSPVPSSPAPSAPPPTEAPTPAPTPAETATPSAAPTPAETATPSAAATP